MKSRQFFIGLFMLAFITMCSINHRPVHGCDSSTVYFDKRFKYPNRRAPSAMLMERALNEAQHNSMNDQHTKYARNPFVPWETNISRSRWMGNESSQPGTENGHTSFTNTDVHVHPSQLQHGLKNKNDAERNTCGLAQLGRASRVEKFTSKDQSGDYVEYKTGMSFKKDEVASLQSKMNLLSDNLLE